MINIHPSLLPSFKGMHTHADALAAGVKIHGCTVHYVVPEMDAGPPIVQAAVPVLADDTPETLGARVLEAEHIIYPLGLRKMIDPDVVLPSSANAAMRLIQY
jgi:phosphoribosylglycinamide formyltransferase-1